MADHDFRYSLLNPEHTLIECRALAPGRYQVTGNGGSIQNGDSLQVTLKGSRDLSMRLQVEKVRHLINPRGQWVAVATGPAFDVEFAVDAALGKKAQAPAAEARIAELGWRGTSGQHTCPRCQKEA